MSVKRSLSPNGCSQVCRDLIIGLLFAASVLATPDSPLPGWTHAVSALFHTRFKETYWPGQRRAASAPVDYGKLAERFSGFAFQRTGRRIGPALAATGKLNAATDAGAIEFWFKLDWTNAAAGGVGPGDTARMVELVVVGDPPPTVGGSSPTSGEGPVLVLVGAGGPSECLTNS